MPHTFATTDVDEIARDLIDAFELVFEEQEQNLCDPIIRWLDYRLRYIEPKPRQILRSEGFNTRVSNEALPALEAFIKLANDGADLNPFQTKTIRQNDTSGAKRQLRTDGLWADWGIHHAHLTESLVATGSAFSARSEWVLFFLMLDNQVAFIDVRSHKEPGIFQAIDLVEKAIRSWPEFAQAWKLKGVISLGRSPITDAQSVKNLRLGGVTQMLEVDGVAYMPPGLGVTTAATSTQVSLKRNRTRQLARHIEQFLSQPGGPLMKAATKKGIGNPSLSLGVLPSGRLAVICPEAEFYFEFPLDENPSNPYSELEYLLLPKWAREKLVIYLSEKQATANTIPHLK